MNNNPILSLSSFSPMGFIVGAACFGVLSYILRGVEKTHSQLKDSQRQIQSIINNKADIDKFLNAESEDSNSNSPESRSVWQDLVTVHNEYSKDIPCADRDLV